MCNAQQDSAHFSGALAAVRDPRPSQAMNSGRCAGCVGPWMRSFQNTRVQSLDHPPESSPAPPEEPERTSTDVEEVIDRIWKEYIFQIDSCVGVAILKGWEVHALAKMLERADMDGIELGDGEVITFYAEVLSGQVRAFIDAVDEINRYTLPKEMFREKVLGEGEPATG